MDNPLQSEEHPVTSGLLALVGVALVVGLVLGLAALAGTRVAGVDQASATNGSPRGGQISMYLPKPEKTTADTGPEITLAPGRKTLTQSPEPSDTKSKKKNKPAKVISLSAGQTSVAPMGRIDLTGTYPGGEGSLLQVQRYENGKWTDFPVSPVSVSNQTFSTYVQTGRPGPQRFRVVDTASGKPSNEVRVTVS